VAEPNERAVDAFYAGEPDVGARRLNQLVEPINALLRRPVASLQPSPPPSPAVVQFKITAIVAGQIGYYVARKVPLSHVGAPEGNLSEDHFDMREVSPEIGTESDEFIAVNLAEVGKSDFHRVPVGRIQWGVAWAGWMKEDENQNRTYVRFYDANNGRFYGLLTGSAFTSGTTIQLNPSSSNGVLTGEAAVTCFVKKDKSSYAMTNGTNVPMDTVVPYESGSDGLYVCGDPREDMAAFRVDGATQKLQYKTRNSWGEWFGTDSDWVDAHTGQLCE
jgi:hypothetical protein